jgi:hypothetical protein
MAMPPGNVPAGIVATTLFVAASITETLLEPRFTTYTLLPSGVVNAIDPGSVPTGIVATTLFVEVSITETVLSPAFET